MIYCNSEFRAYALTGRFNEEKPYHLVYIYIYIFFYFYIYNK